MNIHQLFEDLPDGVIVLTQQGELLFANQYARAICQQISAPPSIMPKQMSQICQTVIDLGDCTLYPEPLSLLEGEFLVDGDHKIRVRVHPFCTGDMEEPCLLILLEDRKRVMQHAAIADAQHYRLTPRETEVWALRRAGYTYSDIANHLYISLDTVRKHLKNIRAKREIHQ